MEQKTINYNIDRIEELQKFSHKQGFSSNRRRLLLANCKQLNDASILEDEDE